MKLFLILTLFISFCKFSASNSISQNIQDKESQVIILKLDDIVANTSNDSLAVSPRWQKVVDYLQKKNIKSTMGIIGFSLEENNEAYFNWIKNVHEGGLVEFWHHGYRQRKNNDEAGEFENNSLEDQKKALQRTQRLAKEKLGISFQVFGAHWSGTNATTVKALETLPDIKYIFYGPKVNSKHLFERIMTLEDPVHIPNFDKFKATYNRSAENKPYLTLQGHPRSWDNERWENFVKIIEFLESKNVVFMTASEYADKNW